MRTLPRPVTALLTTTLVAAGLLLAAPGAGAATGASLTVSGDVEVLPGVRVFHVETASQQTGAGTQQTGAGTTATGTFAGTGELVAGPVSLPLPLALAGPVTCLSVHGDTAAFLYPVDSARPAGLDTLVAGRTSVLFTVTRGTGGAPDRVGFVGPLPSGLFRGCEPTGTPFVFSGTVAITPAT